MLISIFPFHGLGDTIYLQWFSDDFFPSPIAVFDRRPLPEALAAKTRKETFSLQRCGSMFT